jgi:hypothetical protein
MNLLVEIGNREQGTGKEFSSFFILHSSFFILTPDS